MAVPGAPEYVVASSADGAERAAQLLAFLDEAISAKSSGPFLLLVSGGSMVAELGNVLQAAAKGELDWSRVVVGLADERLVSSDSADSTLGSYLRLLDELPDSAIPTSAFLAPVDEALGPAEAAAKYEAALKKEWAGQLDCVLLGLGPDGHTASLFPGHPAFEASRAKADAAQLFVGVSDSPKPPPLRISLTLSAIAAAQRVAFVTAGPAKAPVLKEMLASGPSSALPIAQVTSASGKVHVFADKAALSL